MSLAIFGDSDDLIEVRGHQVSEWDLLPVGTPATMRIVGDHGECFVTFTYTDRGVWEAAISMAAEDEPLPWTFTISTQHGYSVLVEIPCGDDVRVEPLWEVE